jgi:organic radical activating enzyme
MENVKHNNLCVLVTYECDRKCDFCVNAGFVNKRKGFMTKQIFTKGLQWAKDNGKEGIVLNGGEPTLHPNLLEFAMLAKDYGLTVTLFTNYSFPNVVKELDSSGGLDNLVISFYDQKNLPLKSNFRANYFLSTLIWNNRFKSKNELDNYIDSMLDLGAIMFFQNLKTKTTWAKENNSVDFIEELYAESSVKERILWNQKRAFLYRGCIIKFNDVELFWKPRDNMSIDGEIRDDFY